LVNELGENEINEVVLFGSQANGVSNILSDYDILIVLHQTPDWKTERMVSDLLFSIEMKFNIIIDAHLLGKNELDLPRGKQPVFINALKHGIHR
jgi:predicted nucleotidyltransferase